MEKEKTSSSLVLNTAVLVLVIFVSLPYFAFFVGLPTAPPTSFELAKWLRENVNDEGRVFFYVPDHGAQDSPLGGQIPFYQAKTGRSLMGVPAAAMAKKSVDWIQEIGECLKDPKSAPSCRALYNIHYVVTFSGSGNGEAVSLTEGSPDGGVRLVKTIGSIQIYEASQSNNYFLKGRGEVKLYLNRIAVTVEPAEFVVLKFFWVPGLRTTPSLELEPYPLPNGKTFIKVRSNSHRSFDIFYR
jgi:hypothetical protein